jgi:hypothetical protein
MLIQITCMKLNVCMNVSMHDSMSKNHLQKLADRGNLSLPLHIFPFEKYQSKLYFSYRLSSKRISCQLDLPSNPFITTNRVIAQVQPTFLKTRPVSAAWASFCRLRMSRPTTRRWASAWRRTATPIQLHLYKIRHRRLWHWLLPCDSNWD